LLHYLFVVDMLEDYAFYLQEGITDYYLKEQEDVSGMGIEIVEIAQVEVESIQWSSIYISHDCYFTINNNISPL